MDKHTPIISICGLDCGDCPAFLAHKNDNDDLRAQTAKKWAEEFNSPGLKPEDINCLGCLSSEEPLFSNCKVCDIRRCGMAKGVHNCGECADYSGCHIVIKFHEEVPEAKAACDELAGKAA